MVLATVPAAPPTRKNQRATSCPAPISANDPYGIASRFTWSAFCAVPGATPFMVAGSCVRTPEGVHSLARHARADPGLQRLHELLVGERRRRAAGAGGPGP